MKALELFRVKLQGQRGTISRETLQLLDEIPAMGKRNSSPSPTHLDSSLRRKLLANRGNQTIILDFWLEEFFKKKKAILLDLVCFWNGNFPFLPHQAHYVVFLFPLGTRFTVEIKIAQNVPTDTNLSHRSSPNIAMCFKPVGLASSGRRPRCSSGHTPCYQQAGLVLPWFSGPSAETVDNTQIRSMKNFYDLYFIKQQTSIWKNDLLQYNMEAWSSGSSQRTAAISE